MLKILTKNSDTLQESNITYSQQKQYKSTYTQAS